MAASTAHNVIAEFIITNRNSYYRLAYSYVKNRDDALDIVQDSIQKALSSERSLQDPAGIKPWFYRIVINTAIDHLRKHNRCVCVQDETLESLSGSTSDDQPDMDLQKTINQLPIRDKTLIVLRFFEDMKLEDVAMTMNENVNTIKTRVIAILKKMRLNLDNLEATI